MREREAEGLSFQTHYNNWAGTSQHRTNKKTDNTTANDCPPATMKQQGQAPSLRAKAAAAVFYGVSSFAIMGVNKIVLTQYG